MADDSEIVIKIIRNLLESEGYLVLAARELSKEPSSLQLRYLQTLTEIAAERNSTLIFPLPVELLKAFIK